MSQSQRAEDIKQGFAAQHVATQYAVVQYLTEHLSDCCRSFDGDLSQMLVLAILGQRSLQAAMAPSPDGPADAAMTASRIADVTGLPRETVRRKLVRLEARGWIARDATGGWCVALTGDSSFARRDLAALEDRHADRLVRLFLRLSSLADPPSPARNGQPARDDGGKAG